MSCCTNYHPFQNHYTHKIIIFRSLQLQFSGPTGINFRYSYSFVGLTGRFLLYSYCSVQLHKKMVRGIIFRRLQLHKNGFQIINVMISKRMVLRKKTTIEATHLAESTPSPKDLAVPRILRRSNSLSQ